MAKRKGQSKRNDTPVTGLRNSTDSRGVNSDKERDTMRRKARYLVWSM